MFDVGFAELLLIGVVALLVLGPERLPKAARMAGLWMRKARASWYSMRAELEREIADDELKRSLQQARSELTQAQAALRDGGRALIGNASDLGDSLQRDIAGPAATAATASADPSAAVVPDAAALPSPVAGVTGTEHPVPAEDEAGKPAA
jgi:sec-independent protein translocase protein TatB